MLRRLGRWRGGRRDRGLSIISVILGVGGVWSGLWGGLGRMYVSFLRFGFGDHGNGLCFSYYGQVLTLSIVGHADCVGQLCCSTD